MVVLCATVAVGVATGLLAGAFGPAGASGQHAWSQSHDAPSSALEEVQGAPLVTVDHPSALSAAPTPTGPTPLADRSRSGRLDVPLQWLDVQPRWSDRSLPGLDVPDRWLASADGLSWSAVAPAFRAAFLLGVLVVLGAPPTLLFVVHPVARRRALGSVAADWATIRLLVAGLVAVAIGAVGLALGQRPPPASSWSAAASFAGTATGRSLLLRLGLVCSLGSLTGLAVAREGLPSRRTWLASMSAGGLALAVSVGRTNHSAPGVGETVGLLGGLGHQVGAGLWFGGVAVLALVAPAYLRSADDPAGAASALIRRFSVVATTGVTLALATGLVVASWHVSTAGSLAETTYGSVLLAKLGLLLVALGLGGFNRLVVGPQLRDSRRPATGRSVVWAGPAAVRSLLPARLGRGPGTVHGFVRSVRLELLALVLVVALSGVLSSIPTAAVAAQAGDGAATQSVDAADGALLALDGPFGSEDALVVPSPAGQLGGCLQLGARAVAVVGALAVAFELGDLRGRASGG